ncbi:MAG: guanine deaminase [Gammaproteobacteria bacterium]|nr:guanine deaminase [Gammaproteobacteria bacterium]
MSDELKAYRGRLLHCPGAVSSADDCEYLDDGILLVRGGHIEAVLGADQRSELSADIEFLDYQRNWIVPGFIDCHVHYPQLDMIGAYGEQLLDWLETYTYPAEMRFADPDFAANAAEFFLDQLLRHGTTTALVFATVHAHSADALFNAAARRQMRLITGKTLMNRNCPPQLCDTADTGVAESRELIRRWHGRDRLLYAITPRFAPTSTAGQLEMAGELAAEFPDVYIHTHLAETRRECAWVAELFPDRRSYLDVYDHFRLVRDRAVFAHALYVDDRDRDRLAAARAAVAFCPSSNLFLGSGLFDLAATSAAGVRTGLGTDVGGGTSLGLMQTVDDAYKVSQLRGHGMTPWEAFYLATLGGARALHLDDRIGNFATGKEGDFVVLDTAATPLAARRSAAAADHWEELFAAMILADDRMVRQTFVNGRPMSGQ